MASALKTTHDATGNPAATPGVTFAVDAVTPATTSLPECRAHEAVRRTLGDVESCSDYHGTVVSDIQYQPLLAAVYTAFSQHRPLVLTPDAVWLTIAQGVAHHMALHGEELRSRFVSHPGKLELTFTCDGWVEGSPENPWPEAFASWSGQIRDHVGPAAHALLAPDFSTTGPAERAAGDVVMMDVFDRYFHYVLVCICGIPSVTLEGTPADWQRLRDKTAGLSVFDLDWWLEHLLPVCDQFVRASRGDVDLEHWRNVCKLHEAYGGDVINGWVAKLFPYLRAFWNGPCTRRNPVFDTGEGFQTSGAPSGLSRVPFTWRDARTGKERAMEAVGGLLGVTQDPRTLALRPQAGWAVRPAPKLDALLARIVNDAAGHRTFPPDPPEKPAGRGRLDLSPLPPDLCAFYHCTGGAELFAASGPAAVRIVSRRQIQTLGWTGGGEVRGQVQDGIRTGDRPDGRAWHRLALLADGTWLAINLSPERPAHLRTKGRTPWDHDPLFRPICHCGPTTLGQPGRNPVVALSFTELLEKLLDGGGGGLSWLDSASAGYGDALDYTRRG